MDAQKWIVLTLILFKVTWITAQNGFLIDNQNGLYRVTNSCLPELMFTLSGVGTLSDLTLDPDGNLFGISTVGDLYQIDTSGQQAIRIHSFLYLQEFYSLTCAIDGIFYVSGSEGYLYSYVLKGDKEHFYGDVGFNLTGDLLWLHGYLVGTTSDGNLVQVDLLNPRNRRVLAKLPHKSSGLMIRTDPDGSCPTGNLLSLGPDGKIYQFMESTASFTALCHGMVQVSGAAGNEDFYDSDALLQSQIKFNDANCMDEEAAIVVRWRPEQNLVTWTLNDQNQGHDTMAQQLTSGHYVLTTKDATGCQDTLSIELSKTAGPWIESIDIIDAPCQSGSGSVLVKANGTNIAGFRMDDQDLQSSPQFLNVSPGVHHLSVVDSAGCLTRDTVDVTFGVSEPLFTYQISAATCNEVNGSVNLSPLAPGVHFELEGLGTQIRDNKAILPAGRYLIRGIDSSGCQQEVEIAIPDEGCEVFIPTAFSPNQDGVNDVFQIFYPNQQPVVVKEYQIFDRWGALVYADGGFSISGDDHWWDGTRQGKVMGPGVYIYRMVLVNDQGMQNIKQGTVTLLR